jgi:hypothetical protein
VSPGRPRPRRRPTGGETAAGGPALLPAEITCVDCGGRCHRLRPPPEEGDQPGDVVAYRCADCLDRWDLVVAVEPDAGEGDPA